MQPCPVNFTIIHHSRKKDSQKPCTSVRARGDARLNLITDAISVIKMMFLLNITSVVVTVGTVGKDSGL